MTGPRPGERGAAARRTADTAASDLHFLRAVFAELTGQAPPRRPAQPAAATQPGPVKVVRTRPKPLK